MDDTEEINICLPDHFNELAKSLYQLQLNNSLCDMTIFGEDGSINVHSLILSATSSSLREWISNSERNINNMISIYLKGELIQDLQNLVTLIYTGSLLLSTANAKRMIDLLSRVGMKSVVNYLKDNIFPFNERFCELNFIGHSFVEREAYFNVKKEITDNSTDDEVSNRVISLQEESLSRVSAPFIQEDTDQMDVNVEFLLSDGERTNKEDRLNILAGNQNHKCLPEVCAEINETKNGLRENDSDGLIDRLMNNTEQIDRVTDSVSQETENLQTKECNNFSYDGQPVEQPASTLNASAISSEDVDEYGVDQKNRLPKQNLEDQVKCEQAYDEDTDEDNMNYEDDELRKEFEVGSKETENETIKNFKLSDHTTDNKMKVDTVSLLTIVKSRTNKGQKKGKHLDKCITGKSSVRKRKLSDNSKTKTERRITKKKLKTSQSTSSEIESSHLDSSDGNSDMVENESAVKADIQTLNVKERNCDIEEQTSSSKDRKPILRRNCRLCNVRFDNVEDYYRHRNEKHKYKRVVTDCGLCKEKFDSREDYLKHREEKHKNIHKEMYDRRAYHVCTYKGCDYKNKHKGFLIRHMNLEHGDLIDESETPIFRCEVEGCSYFHVQQSRIRCHMREQHSQVGEVICDICGKALKHIKSLKNHKRSCHISGGEKNYDFSCTHCDKKYHTQSALNLHMRRHQGHKFLCHFCTYSSTDLSRKNLDIHLFKVHQVPLPKNIQTFRCTQCDYYTFYKPLIRHHLSAHSAVKFECETCGKAYESEFRLKQHIYRAHKAEKKKCPHDGCTYYGLSDNMKEHIQNMHTFKNTKPFACHLCDYRCTNQGNLYKHLRGKHKLQFDTIETLWRKQKETGQGYDAIFNKSGSIAREKL